MLEYILNEYGMLTIEYIKSNFKDGDIFNMFSTILDFTINFVLEEKSNNFFINIFSDIKVNKYIYNKLSNDEHKACLPERLKELIDIKKLDIREEDDFNNIFDILCSIFINTTAEVFLNISEYSQIRERYNRKLKLLKRSLNK